MALVDYGSSEDSGSEEQQSSGRAKSKPRNPAKPTFHKLVDSSNPNKIKVNLSQSNEDLEEKDSTDGPPPKRAKIGARVGGGLKDFNSILPAPKRAAASIALGRGGLGRGVNLKTGSTPVFTREPMPVEQNEEEDSELLSGKDLSGLPEGKPIIDHPPTTSSMMEDEVSTERAKKKTTMFRPLSVVRKPQKKKPPLGPDSDGRPVSTKPSDTTNNSVRKVATEMSLFSSHTDSSDHDVSNPHTSSSGAYKPMLYQPSTDSTEHSDLAASLELSKSDPLSGDVGVATSAINGDQSLDAIATSLNLTPSQKRQLLGRDAAKSSAQAIKVTNFNTDAEYAANEELRQSGEVVQHQAIRPIAGGGKHSLKQLVSSAVGQKDALDEKFAEGSRNRKEGAGRYGW